MSNEHMIESYNPLTWAQVDDLEKQERDSRMKCFIDIEFALKKREVENELIELMSQKCINDRAVNVRSEMTDALRMYPELFAPYDDRDESFKESRKLFKRALFLAFDVPEELRELRHQISNRDLLWLPTCGPKKLVRNYFQLASASTEEREPIDECFHYLFKNAEPHYHEPYMFSTLESEERSAFHSHIRKRYSSAQEYLIRVQHFLWLVDDLEECNGMVSKIWVHK